jgi:hypothetical protein
MHELTPAAKYIVITIDPKYTAVKGKRGPEIRCVAYAYGPMRAAHDARKRTEPADQLCQMSATHVLEIVYTRSARA